MVARTDSSEKALMLGKTEGRRRREWQRMRWLYGITDSMDVSLSKLRETVKDAWHATAMGSQRADRTEQLKKNNKVYYSTLLHQAFLFLLTVYVGNCFIPVHKEHPQFLGYLQEYSMGTLWLFVHFPTDDHFICLQMFAI